MIRFSIVIPLYNKEKHIKNTLKSVLAQTLQDFEVLVINDGSTDNSAVEVITLKDERIILFNIENQGVSYARNFGVSNANSNLIVFLDADDLWKPYHLEHLYSLYQNFPNCGLYATAYEYQFNTKKIASIYYGITKTEPWMGIVDDFFESSKINCIASSSSVMIPNDVYKSLNGFDTRYTSGEDIDLWIRIALKHNIAFTNNVSVTIDMDAENQASQTSIYTRKLLDLDSFKEEKFNQSLKAYLDLNRFSISIQHKLARNHLKAKEIINNIDLNNLNTKQRFLLHMNTPILKLFVQTKKFLRQNGIGLSAFR